MSNKKIRDLKFAFRQGARYSVDAQVVGEELDRIQRQNGQVQPKAVVEAAKPVDAPLHPVFEWRDEIAADNYRNWQARKLIKSVTIVQPETNQVSPAYVNVPTVVQSEGTTASKGGYQPVSVVVNRPDMYAMALSQLASKVQSAQASLEELRRAAEQSPETDHERMARIAIAVQAMQAASAAVSALH